MRGIRWKVGYSRNLRSAELLIQLAAELLYQRDGLKGNAVHRWHRVYRLVDPRDQSAFYIGQGDPNRLQEHESQAAKGKDRSPKCERIRQIWAAGLKPEYQTIGLFTDRDRAHRFEWELIGRYGDSLTNLQRPKQAAA